MNRFKSTLCASLITLALSSSALAGDISTGRATAGDISTGMATSGDISTGKAGVISIGKATDAGVEALLFLISLATF